MYTDSSLGTQLPCCTPQSWELKMAMHTSCNLFRKKLSAHPLSLMENYNYVLHLLWYSMKKNNHDHFCIIVLCFKFTWPVVSLFFCSLKQELKRKKKEVLFMYIYSTFETKICEAYLLTQEYNYNTHLETIHCSPHMSINNWKLMVVST